MVAPNVPIQIYNTPFNLHQQLKRTKLANLYPKLASFVQDEENITLALNEEYIPMGEVKNLKEGDTVALIPPISGG
jgi:molybdopterin converting factor small subunit